MKQTIIHFIHTLFAYFGKKYADKYNPLVIGVTGSVGKTSCRMLVYDVCTQLLPHKKIYTSPKNFNSELGLVFSLFAIESYTPGIMGLFKACGQVIYRYMFVVPAYDVIVLEYGIDHPGDMGFLTQIVRPDYSIFTKLDFVHGAFFKNIEAIGDEKFVLMQQTKVKTYLNAADEYAKKAAIDLSVPVCWYNDEQIQIRDYKLKKTDQNIVCATAKYGKINIISNLVGEEHMYYIALGIDIAKQIDSGVLIHSLQISSQLQQGRCNILSGIQDSIIIDSSYNASPASMEKMITTLRELHSTIYADYTMICVIGDMRELGEHSAGAHTHIASLVSSIPHVYTVGPEMQRYIPTSHNFVSSQTAGKQLKQYIQDHPENKYIILVKGSQNTIFTEEAIKPLLENSQDIKNLVRQSPDWIEKKERFFQSL